MLLGLYTTDTTDALGRAQSAPPAELPPSFAEGFHAAFSETRAYANSDALWRARHEVVQGALDALENATGEVYANPEAAPRGPNRDALEKSIRARFDSLKGERPDLNLSYPTDDEIQAGAVAKAQKAKGERDALSAKPGSFSSGAGFVLGDIAGAMTDPLNIASMFMGAGPAAGILKTAAIEAGIAAGSQAVIEAGTAPFKQQVDPQYGLADAAGNIAAAGAGGAIIGGGLKALGKGVELWRGRDRAELPREVQDALNVVERDEQVRASNPLPGVAGEQAHVGAMTKAAQDIEAGRPVDVQPIVQEARAAAPSVPLAPDRVFTSGGRSIDVEYRVVEADQLVSSHGADGTVNPAFPPELQPRDRTRVASQAQIADMAANLQPERLGPSPDAATGAPIIGPDMVVESGNGRVGAIRTAYERGGEAADRYRAWVTQRDPAAADMRNPVLVAVRKTDMDPAGRAAFANEANQATAARLSPTEQARADARMVNNAVLSQVRSGDVTAASNRGAVRSWLDGLSVSERSGLVDADGGLNQEGRRRFEGALLSRAYDAPDLIGKLVEDLDNDIKAIGGAMQDAAGPWAKMRAAAARGDIPPALDPTARLLDAVRLVQRARESGQKVFDLLNQEDIFSGQVDPITGAFVRMFFRNDGLTAPAGRKSVAEALSGYVDEAMAENGGGLLGRAERPGQILLGEERAPPVPPARPAEEVARAPETHDALYQEVNRLLASRELDVPMGEVVDEAGNVVPMRRSAMDLMDEADRAINDAATIAACAFGVAAE
ncbi:hypothetical protein [Azospirillum rugosum]|uniref:DdrB-like domain-containing protein n=1 Tax=Azospirillum rugosum TaxID=416170 RepID=A0ABS4SDT0_9PROT|nr:hypothetical protein [Azospirillum rugosum]MBP2290714.1 hypothetical protein [Azospirillum rugosum]MDQ0525603.1 hypothetical protein [Azospirillum rugosum]